MKRDHPTDHNGFLMNNETSTQDLPRYQLQSQETFPCTRLRTISLLVLKSAVNTTRHRTAVIIIKVERNGDL